MSFGLGGAIFGLMLAPSVLALVAYIRHIVHISSYWGHYNAVTVRTPSVVGLVRCGYPCACEDRSIGRDHITICNILNEVEVFGMLMLACRMFDLSAWMQKSSFLSPL